MQNRTLITGWWGVISFFANWMTVGRNAIAARRLQGLPVPSQSPDAASTLGASLDPGKPLVQRAGVWVAVAVIVVLGAVLASESSSSSGYGGSTGYTPPTGTYRAPSSYTPPTGSYRVPTTYTVPGDAGNWSYSQESEVRSAATRAGFSSIEASCIVRYVSSRYSVDQVSKAALERAVSYCE
jgi:hypothetical protein